MGLLTWWNGLFQQAQSEPIVAAKAGKVDRTPAGLEVTSPDYPGVPRTLAYRNKLWTEIESEREGIAVFMHEVAIDGRPRKNTVSVNNADLTQRSDGCWILFEHRGN